ncbi:MAG: indolepyruvate oxidoreductase subunit beta [Deltaproteobacteria bacterium]|nr:indolepyruvate oxidoreductase subunit beta [Deltaproteobacteria bacterium]
MNETKAELKFDPYNLIITGVGGQGNVTASRLLGKMLSKKGYFVTIGETFGASQRGGSVMSHLRISAEETYSPIILRGQGHMVVAMEPTEAIRVLADYGNMEIKVICNTRPIHPMAVVAGEQTYPSPEDIEERVNDISGQSWFINATDEAMADMKNPVYGNIMLLGAVAATGELPIEKDDFEAVISATMPADKVSLNLKAYDRGLKMLDRG